MLNNLPFLQDPRRFLQSYFWGCGKGHALSAKCKQQFERTAVAGLADSSLTDKMMESLLDCYVHTKICPRCKRIDQITCKRGYELMKERDAAIDEAVRLDVMDWTPERDSESPLTPEQTQAVLNKELVQQDFLKHMGSCEVCSLKQPQGRYAFAAWNIKAALQQRLG